MVMASLPATCQTKDWRNLAEMLLEGSNVDGIYLANKSVLALYGGGRTTGVCVDTGHDMTYAVPCWEGSVLEGATVALKKGGCDITEKLMGLLAKGKYSFPDDTYLLMSSKRRFRVATRRDVVKDAKERFCFVKHSKSSTGRGEQVMRLPDGNMVVVGEEEAHKAAEVLFEQKGLPEAVLECVMACEEKLRPRLLSNIVLAGGNSLLPGMDVRLKEELDALLPNGGANVRVQAQAGRKNFTWDGGAHLCELSSFQRLWMSKEEFLEQGL